MAFVFKQTAVLVVRINREVVIRQPGVGGVGGKWGAGV